MYQKIVLSKTDLAETSSVPVMLIAAAEVIVNIFMYIVTYMLHVCEYFVS